MSNISDTVLESREIGTLRVSVVGLGCNNFGWHIDFDAAQRVVDAALESGITFFDTADIYGGTQSEDYLGRALGRRRDEVVIATKFGMKIDSQRPGGARPEYIQSAVEESLRRLRTDRIDLYYLHQPDPSTPLAETLGALETLRQQGKILEYGCSNFAAPDLLEAQRVSEGAGFAAVQNEFNLLHREPESSGVLRATQSLGMAFIPYFPLKSGLLTGKYRGGRDAPKGSRLDTDQVSRFSSMGRELLTDRNLAVVEELIAFTESRGRTLLELAFSWLLSKPMVTSVIAGATKPEQIESNASATHWKLTADELSDVQSILDAHQKS